MGSRAILAAVTIIAALFLLWAGPASAVVIISFTEGPSGQVDVTVNGITRTSPIADFAQVSLPNFFSSLPAILSSGYIDFAIREASGALSDVVRVAALGTGPTYDLGVRFWSDGADFTLNPPGTLNIGPRSIAETSGPMLIVDTALLQVYVTSDAVQSVPAPSTLLLLGFGLTVLSTSIGKRLRRN